MTQENEILYLFNAVRMSLFVAEWHMWGGGLQFQKKFCSIRSQ